MDELLILEGKGRKRLGNAQILMPRAICNQQVGGSSYIISSIEVAGFPEKAGNPVTFLTDLLWRCFELTPLLTPTGFKVVGSEFFPLSAALRGVSDTGHLRFLVVLFSRNGFA